LGRRRWRPTLASAASAATTAGGRQRGRLDRLHRGQIEAIGLAPPASVRERRAVRTPTSRPMRRQRRPRRPASPLASLRTRRSPASTGAGLVPGGARRRASRRQLPKAARIRGARNRDTHTGGQSTPARRWCFLLSSQRDDWLHAHRAGERGPNSRETTPEAAESATPAKVTGSNGLT